jgi:hypothetical protein
MASKESSAVPSPPTKRDAGSWPTRRTISPWKLKRSVMLSIQVAMSTVILNPLPM